MKNQMISETVAAESFGTPPWPMSTPEAMLEIMAGNHDAVRMMGILAVWSHVYDDLIDKDKPVADKHIHDVMWSLLIELPTNPFYKRNEESFRPLIASGILNWHAANQMEKSGCIEQLYISHAIRYSICDVAYLAMIFCGGLDHAVANASKCRLLMQHDTLSNYLTEHKNA